MRRNMPHISGMTNRERNGLVIGDEVRATSGRVYRVVDVDWTFGNEVWFREVRDENAVGERCELPASSIARVVCLNT